MSDQKNRVGRGRPPLHTRFQKGRSGNPSGRPKGRRNLHTVMIKELLAPVTAKENGRPVRVSKVQLLIKSLLAQALGGDMRAANIVSGMITQLSQHMELPAVNSEDARAPEDAAIVADFLVRARGGEDHD